MQLQKIAQIIGVNVEKNPNIAGFSVDTRLTKPGDLFFALKGAKVDGHDFLQEAKKQGAIAAVVKRDFNDAIEGLDLLKVDNVLETLQKLAQWVIAQTTAKIIAITGSVGKTTTKDFLTTLLSEKFKVVSLAGNQNSQIGLPIGVLNSNFNDKEIIILEMGMDAPGQLTQLTQIAPPDVAIITATTLQHGKNFNSIEAIGCAKSEIFSHPKTTLGILSKDIVSFEEMKNVGKFQKLSFSTTKPEADYFLHENEVGLTITEGLTNETFDPLPVPGKHNLHNFLGAVAIARNFGLTWNEIRRGAAKLILPERRLQMVQMHGATFINDSYNACEISMKAAIVSVPSPQPGGKKIACLGEMCELGSFSEQCHREVGKKSLENIDLMLCLGDGCRPIVECWTDAGRPVYIFNDRSKLVDKLREVLEEGDCVLLKGSRSKQMWKVIEEL